MTPLKCMCNYPCSSGDSTCKLGWSQEHPNLQKIAYVHLLKNSYIYAKLIYCEHLNKNVEYSDLRITKIWVQQK